MKKLTVALTFCCLVFSDINIIKAQLSTEKPNILLIETDQQRYDTIAELGNSVVKTPNLDRLIKQGTAFTHAFAAAPVCMPGRWSLHSGMYTTTHQAYSNHHEGVIPKTSLPMELKRDGYRTALIGKNHSFLGKPEFDFISPTPDYLYDLDVKRMGREPLPGTLEEDPMHRMTDTAMEYISGNIPKPKPFFIWLSYFYPHTPFVAPEPYFSMYDTVSIPKPVVEPEGLKKAGKPFRQIFHRENNDRLLAYSEKETLRMKRTYYGMISLVDHEIGRLLDFLEKQGLRENTIIIFTSDHGDYQGDHHMYTKSPAMYDCLIRVPLIFSWPGQVRENKRSEELVSHVDIMPTLLSFTRRSIPNQVQGIDLTSYLRGNYSGTVREVVFAEYGLPGEPFTRQRLEEMLPNYKSNPIDWAEAIPWEANPISLAGRFRMARSKDWKYVQYPGETDELYNLGNDPNELENLTDNPNYADKKEYLKKKLEDWKKSLPGIEKDCLDYVTPFFNKYLGEQASSD